MGVFFFVPRFIFAYGKCVKIGPLLNAHYLVWPGEMKERERERKVQINMDGVTGVALPLLKKNTHI